MPSTRPARSHVALLVTAALALSPSEPGATDRAQIPVKYTWNLADLFPDSAAWVVARSDLEKRLAGLARHRGHLGDSAAALAGALDDFYGLQLAWGRLAVYARALSDEDVRAPRPREMKQTAEHLQIQLRSASSFIEPEILALDPAKVRRFAAEEKRLAPYAFFLDDLLRRKPHTLGAPEERILAEARAMADAGESAYAILSNADLPYPTVKLSTGEVRLDAAAYTLHRAAPLREDREQVFGAFFGALRGFERTMGATLDAQVKAHVFERKVRSFPAALDAALFPHAIPTAVYRQLVADVRRSLPTLHRYLDLRRRILGLEELRYSDLYVPLVPGVEQTYTPEQARAVVLEALAPLGPDYVAALRTGFESRWTDFLPTTGKRSGAYSTGVWGVHPYQLLNFNGQYDDVSTLAHESGHSMHTWLASRGQPFATAHYPIFLAEIASTLNENLLVHHLLGKAGDDGTRLTLLGNALENMRTALFRQVLFAEFELAVHDLADRGEPITGERLSAMYLKLTREYYGHERGLCRVDDAMAIEWAYIPHFYLDFYVYQYATSIVLSTSFSKAIREEAARGSTAARDRYLKLLSAGGSGYPIDLLRAAGVDPTTSAPFDAAMAEMNGVMDEMDRILARRSAARPGG